MSKATIVTAATFVLAPAMVAMAAERRFPVSEGIGGLHVQYYP